MHESCRILQVSTSAVLLNSVVAARGMGFPRCVSFVSFTAFDLHCRFVIQVGGLVDVSLTLKEGSVGGAGKEEFS